MGKYGGFQFVKDRTFTYESHKRDSILTLRKFMPAVLKPLVILDRSSKSNCAS